MLQNYIVAALRNLFKHKTFTAINVSGLAVGIACCLLILIYVRHELSYDNFHEGADNLYRVAMEIRQPDATVKLATTPRSLIDALKTDLSEVVAATRLSREHSSRVLVSAGDKHFFEEGVVFADSNFLEFFSVSLLQGNPETVLDAANSVVITEKIARKYFGASDPIGKIISLRLQGDRDVFDYQVTGVTPGLPDNSHFHFDFLVSYQLHPFTLRDGQQRAQWLGASVYSYVRLAANSDPNALTAKLAAIIDKNVGPSVENRLGMSYEDYLSEGNRMWLFLQPIREIHLKSHLRGELAQNNDIVYVYVFAAVAIFILLLACVNFINLAAARSADRAREVGIRRVVGSSRAQLIRQFLTESILLSTLALIMAIGLIELFMPAFNQLTGKTLSLGLFTSPWVVPALIGLAAVIGIVAGFYPAFLLSSFQPVAVLKGRFRNRTGGKRGLRNALMFFQFSVSIVLIIATMGIQQQLSFMFNRKLGFEKERTLVIEGTEILGQQVEAFKQKLLQIPEVTAAAHAESVPGREFNRVLMRPERAASPLIPLATVYTGFDYVETLNLELKSGRSLRQQLATDSLAVLLNEAAVRELGLTDPLGQRIVRQGNGQTYTIVGIVKDFHFESLHKQMAPVAMVGPDPYYSNRPRQTVAIRLASSNLNASLGAISGIWQEFVPDQPFTFSFLDADLDALYKSEVITQKLFAYFSALAIFIACLGLFGLSAFIVNRRVKEIGIRKVLGATVLQIVTLLSKDFTLLVIGAFTIAAPATNFALESWLQNFAYRTDIGLAVFALAGFGVLLVAILATSSQAITAALMSPVETLKHE